MKISRMAEGPALKPVLRTLSSLLCVGWSNINWNGFSWNSEFVTQLCLEISSTFEFVFNQLLNIYLECSYCLLHPFQDSLPIVFFYLPAQPLLPSLLHWAWYCSKSTSYPIRKDEIILKCEVAFFKRGAVCLKAKTSATDGNSEGLHPIIRLNFVNTSE